MLIHCPECQNEISNKAPFCPHCGMPQKSANSRKQPQTSRKRLRLPNGFGQITKLSNPRLRKPYRAMITVGKTDTGKPICKLLKPVAYFSTYNEAYEALLKYHNDPISTKVITVKELYAKWYEEYSSDRPGISMKNYSSAFKNIEALHDLSIANVKAREIRDAMTNAKSVSVRKNIKTLLNKLFDYAIEYEYVARNYARESHVPIGATTTSGSHKSFTDDEIQILWKNEEVTAPILIHCYTGFRPTELIELKLKNINLTEWKAIGGSKTEAGTNRMVPIHSKIRPLIKRFYEEAVNQGRDTLLKFKNYDAYNYWFEKTIGELRISKHRSHDCRKHFVTMAKRAGVDEYALKRIVGHSIRDLTERVYTDRDFAWLAQEIEKIE